jgi:hypothetical protein
MNSITVAGQRRILTDFPYKMQNELPLLATTQMYQPKKHSLG